MNDAPDATLLEQFALSQSEAAFAELVKRHISLVYSVAFRKTGNPQQAEDITQAVFIILARKAGSLGAKTVLPGWLYHTARLTAANAQRAEIRRFRHEQEAFMQSIEKEPAPEAFWRELSPALEDAMAGLGANDRDALVLRYFQNLSLADVGAALGTTEGVAQRRVSRALEKLRRLFARRGVHSTTAVIAGTISTNSLQIVPPALAQAVTTVALTNGAAASASTLSLVKGALKIIAWTKAKMAIAIGVAVVVATGTTTIVVAKMRSPKPVHLAPGALPETLAELNAWYIEPPAGQNAATYILQGVNVMQPPDAKQKANLPNLSQLPPPDPSAPLPPAENSALAGVLQQNQDALRFFAQGARYEQSRYPVDFTTVMREGLPYLQGVDEGAQLFEMEAILDAENGGGQKAADDVAMILSLARSLRAEPVIISQLVRVKDTRLAVTALNQSVNRTTLPPESLSALAKMFADIEAYDAGGEGFYRALVGEKVMHIALLNNRKELLLGDAKSLRLMEYADNDANLRAEKDYSTSTFQKLFIASHDPFPDRRTNVNDVIQQRMSYAQHQGLLLSVLHLSSLAHLGGREADGIAYARLAMTAIALEQYRAAHGNRYPDSLSELVPAYLNAPLMDPYDGNPLRFRTLGPGYVLYSVGPDLKDDGGNRTKWSDLVFAVTRPPAY